MPSMCSDLVKVDLNGPTMGTRWHVQFWTRPRETGPIRDALQQAVDAVDAQMSLWKPDSTLCRLNRAAPGVWVPLEPQIAEVLAASLDIARASGGAFEIALGDVVKAWGFGPTAADPQAMAHLMQAEAPRATEVLDLDGLRARKRAPAHFDLNGIAKGYGVDQLVKAAQAQGIHDLTAAIDGDLRCVGTRPDGTLWPIAVEEPDHSRRAVHSLMEMTDTAIATSGDYRHWVDLGGQRLSHTMHPLLRAPLQSPPASVSVLAADCMTADAWATALMVLGREQGTAIARAHGIQAMFLERQAA
ncbi:FAD:protein FMN transferase [Sagittula sp. S175]|uniref:FAD:protein FMN transferase n=1 Tax=Sagittula sp. S175 TaxID=3415129 RepID=UPI003C79BB4D